MGNDRACRSWAKQKGSKARALAEFATDLTVERTNAGIEAARKRGRPRKLNSTQLEHAKKLIKEGTSRNQVARILDINPCTLYRNLQKTA